MNHEQASAFLTALGAYKPTKNGKWVQSGCPLAPALHKGHKDNNPSFGITCQADKPSRYNCFACGHGSALELIHAMEFHGLKANFALARQILELEELEVVPLPGYGEFQVDAEEKFVYRPWDEYWLADYPYATNIPAAREYLASRLVTDEEADKFDLRYDLVRQMIVFPIREAYGTLAGARGRAIDDSMTGPARHHDYSHKNTSKNIKGVWFNEQALQLPGPVVVVEGQFDALRVSKVWPKVVGNLTAKPTAEKVMKLALTPGVIHIPDNDEAGVQSVARFTQSLAKYKTPYVVLSLAQYGIKDPGECHPQFLADRIADLANALC